MRSRVPPLLSLALLAGLALGASGCNRRERECEALRGVVRSVQAGYGAKGSLAGLVERSVAEIDRIGPTSSVAKVAADYRAALASVAAAARGAEASIGEVAATLEPRDGGPAAGVDLDAERAAIEKHLTALATPCVSEMFSGLASIFRAPDAGPPEVRRDTQDCDALGKIFLLFTQPPPQVSLAAHVHAVVVALEDAKLTDPALAGSAKELAATLRRLDPAFRWIRVPAAELLALAARMTEGLDRLKKARAEADEREAALLSACRAGR